MSWECIGISFKEKFTHHSADRSQTETVIVKISNGKGVVSFGEGCPRVYVTNESYSTVVAFYQMIKDAVEQIQTLLDLKNFMVKNEASIDQNPAAWCAVEMALLDLIAKEEDVSVESLLEIDKGVREISYTAVLGIDSFPSFLRKALIYRFYGFSHFKIKLSGNKSQDKKALLTLAFLGVGKNHIRADGNNLWASKEEAIAYLMPLKKYIWAIEEPLLAHEFEGMHIVAKALRLKIILDESFLNIQSLDQIKEQQESFIPNLRISKMGGVLRTLAIIKKLEEQNFKWILGSHVGEMSLLTRASLLVAMADSKSHLMAKEGAFSTHLLTEDPFYPNLKFGKGAVIKFNKHSDPRLLRSGWSMEYRYRHKEKS